jgi:hypothetical protein
LIPKGQVGKETLDLSDPDNVANNSDDEDRSLSPSPSKVKNKSRYNLLNYNSERKGKLNEFDYSMDITKDEDDFDLNEAVTLATQIKTNRCNGDLVISLFWEEKFVIIVRYLQLYGLIFFFYYENWPANTRLWLTNMFCGFNFSFYITTQDQFYAFMQDFN